jgi:hypothetical protein
MDLTVINHNKQPRGMALVIVALAMSVAAVVALALLTAAASQASIGPNGAAAVRAQAVSQGGFDTALYYLQWPSLAPTNWTSTTGYTLYAHNVPIPNDPQGASYNVQVQPAQINNEYTVQVTGNAYSGSPVTRTSSSLVLVTRLTIPAAGVFGSSIAVPPGMLLSSNLQLGGQAIFTGGTIVNAGGSVVGSTTTSPLPTPAYQIPAPADVNYFGVEGSGQYTMPNGTIGTPQPVGSSLTAAPIANSATNPGQVFYAIGDTQVSGGFTLNGTLIVRGGNLIVGGAGFTITPQSGMPAILCDQGIELQTGTATVQANGVVYAGNGVTWDSGSQAALNINGALIIPTGATITPSASGQANILFNRSATNITNLTNVPQPASNISLLVWGATTISTSTSSSTSGGLLNLPSLPPMNSGSNSLQGLTPLGGF